MANKDDQDPWSDFISSNSELIGAAIVIVFAIAVLINVVNPFL